MKLRIFIVIVLGGVIASYLLGCAPPVLRKPVPSEIPIILRERTFPPSLIDDGDRESLINALEKSLTYLEKGRSAGRAGDFFSAERVQRTLTLFRGILLSASTEGEIARKMGEAFTLWEFTRGTTNPPILLTGYYEPSLEGSLEPGGEYRYPIYRRPADLVEISSEGIPGSSTSTKRLVRMENGIPVPYYSRREIDAEGALRGRGLELAWLKDPWERFVLHVQGSGQIRFPDGKTMRVGFAASNGRPYRSIGRYLVDRGFLSEKEVNLTRIKEFLQANPGRAEETYWINERYIFFRPLVEPSGPIGALGVPLTPGRSVATDLAIFPPGAPALLISRQPILDESGKKVGWKPLLRLVFNQDTGAAMKGPWRVDLFFGSGEIAGMAAGGMREDGRIYFLLAK